MRLNGERIRAAGTSLVVRALVARIISNYYAEWFNCVKGNIKARPSPLIDPSERLSLSRNGSCCACVYVCVLPFQNQFISPLPDQCKSPQGFPLSFSFSITPSISMLYNAHCYDVFCTPFCPFLHPWTRNASLQTTTAQDRGCI